VEDIIVDIIEALTDREAELAMAAACGFLVGRRLEAVRSLLRRLQDIASAPREERSQDRSHGLLH
jgi:hypothetical protein